jgi:hypothetical protein
MADEAFALSPISARAAQPSEADYDAIKEAFMETSRGRWFLGEYAKRNRNADTTMVLDAVARIEETLVASRKPVRDPLLDEALASLRTALGEAREAATAALNDLALEQNLAPVRKGARVIREIAWRLREIGADGRICDLIDSQVAAIEGAAAQMVPTDLAAALNGAFEGIEGKIRAFDGEDADAPPPPAAEAPMPEEPATTAATEAPAEIQIEEPVHVEDSVAAAETAPIASVVNAVEEAEVAIADADEAPAADVAETTGDVVDAFDANDEALLDAVAMEMAAPDSDAAYDPPIEELEAEAPEAQIAEVSAPQTSEPQPGKMQESADSWEIDVTFVSDAADTTEEPVAATATLPEVMPLQPEAEPTPEPEPEPAPSLGSSLLASGIVARPRTSRPDPLAPIRRMSQSEKIAFFS